MAQAPTTFTLHAADAILGHPVHWARDFALVAMLNATAPLAFCMSLSPPVNVQGWALWVAFSGGQALCAASAGAAFAIGVRRLLLGPLRTVPFGVIAAAGVLFGVLFGATMPLVLYTVPFLLLGNFLPGLHYYFQPLMDITATLILVAGVVQWPIMFVAYTWQRARRARVWPVVTGACAVPAAVVLVVYFTPFDIPFTSVLVRAMALIAPS